METILPAYVEHIASEIVDIAVNLHKELGPGLLESVYEKCFCHELENRGISYKKQQFVPIHYKGLYIEDGLRLDIIVEDEIIIELKAQEASHKVWEAQLISYLKMTNKKLGFILNFHVQLMKHGIKRIIL